MWSDVSLSRPLPPSELLGSKIADVVPTNVTTPSFSDLERGGSEELETLPLVCIKHKSWRKRALRTVWDLTPCSLGRGALMDSAGPMGVVPSIPRDLLNSAFSSSNASFTFFLLGHSISSSSISLFTTGDDGNSTTRTGHEGPFGTIKIVFISETRLTKASNVSDRVEGSRPAFSPSLLPSLRDGVSSTQCLLRNSVVAVRHWNGSGRGALPLAGGALFRGSRSYQSAATTLFIRGSNCVFVPDLRATIERKYAIVQKERDRCDRRDSSRLASGPAPFLVGAKGSEIGIARSRWQPSGNSWKKCERLVGSVVRWNESRFLLPPRETFRYYVMPAVKSTIRSRKVMKVKGRGRRGRDLEGRRGRDM
ncbi:unnamed protein product [Darwinula stevensoni]|uniref:Uncharacterized protein n=1 Tax=Darwinula stevensoni TaxID=69355 RepID=A0A7R9AH73_9CRUS|nr:unnamed protein product [Darwinula stevensoni]CAG0904593.1 unnamed protein product [Darwinula stevensoni]